jgi:hypothetical protein
MRSAIFLSLLLVFLTANASPIIDVDAVAEGSAVLLFWPSLVGAAMIMLVHLLVPQFEFMRKPSNVWVPASAGVALAYVFMDIFPHLAKSKAKLVSTGDSPVYEFLTQHIYFVSFVGFAVYLGIVLAEIIFHKENATADITFRSAPAVIQFECISLAGYSFLIGYLLSEQITHRTEPAMLFGLAMAIHFAGLYYLTRGNFPRLYDGTLRYALAASVLAGWLTGVVFEISNTSLELWYSFLAGGMIVVAAVYELPHIHTRRQYWAFLVGSGVFSLIILLIKAYEK